jgi:DNA-binding Xre family transcriptional regulator
VKISYDPLWETMKKRGKTTYDIKVKDKVVSGSTYSRLKSNMSVTTHIIGVLCEYLDCEVEEIMCRVKEKYIRTKFSDIVKRVYGTEKK